MSEPADAGRHPRAQAQALLRGAQYIFIAYTSADLGAARDLRNRIVKMRRPASESTVFMASDSLAVAQAVDPPRIEAELQRADLFVLVSGSLTPKSPFVQKEVEQALAQRATGRTQILPVIVKAGVTLPQGVDFTIQAIHFSTLFPAIRRLRIAVTAALIAAIAATVIVGMVAAKRSRDRDVIALRAALQTTGLQATTAIDEKRRDWLVTQRAEAQRLGAAEELRDIDAQLARYAPPELRRTWLPADRNRTSLVVDPAGDAVWLGYEHRIEKRALDGKLLREIDLQSLEVMPYQPPPILAREKRPASDGPMLRSPGRLIGLRTDPRVSGILAEVEYPENFAERGEKEQLAHLGYDSDGSERELLAIPHDSMQIQSVGLTVALTAENDATGDLGRYDSEVKQDAAIESTLAGATPAQQSLLSTDWRKGDQIERIAVDPRSGSVAFHLVTDMGPRDDHTGTFRFEGWQKHSAVRLDPSGQKTLLGAEIDFFPEGARMVWPDDEPNPFTATAPKYVPAAVSSTSTTLGYKLPWRMPEADKPAIKAFWSAGNGAILRVHLNDGSVAAVDGKAIRRFPASASARSIDVSSDGKTALILHSDGRVDVWDLHPFGEDGWIAHRQNN